MYFVVERDIFCGRLKKKKTKTKSFLRTYDIETLVYSIDRAYCIQVVLRVKDNGVKFIQEK